MLQQCVRHPSTSKDGSVSILNFLRTFDSSTSQPFLLSPSAWRRSSAPLPPPSPSSASTSDSAVLSSPGRTADAPCRVAPPGRVEGIAPVRCDGDRLAEAQLPDQGQAHVVLPHLRVHATHAVGVGRLAGLQLKHKPRRQCFEPERALQSCQVPPSPT